MSSQELLRIQGLKRSLADLRPILEKPEQQGYLTLFDEFVDQHEFGLALHCICDYLLEPQARAADATTIERIGALHSSMRIEDDCIESLREKAKLDV